MNNLNLRNPILLVCLLAFGQQSRLAAQSVPAEITNTVNPNPNSVKIQVKPYLGANQLKMLTTPSLSSAYTTNAQAFAGYDWTNTLPGTSLFYKAQVTPLSSNEQLAAVALNRLAYGPTPDLLDRLLQNSPPNDAQTWINEQLAMETITETVTNGAYTNVIANVASRFPEGWDQFVYTNNPANAGYNSAPGSADLNHYRAWFVAHAIGAKRQLLEVLSQFLENHFVTEWEKSRQFFPNATPSTRLATKMEYLEMKRWRVALLTPTCTFSNLLTSHAESPAEIIYLDTTTSRGDGLNIANENYAREIMELFCMGVDNGYDQNDITVMSPAWTGWNTQFVTTNNAFNVFAAGQGGSQSNLQGVWVFNFRSDHHGYGAKKIFPAKSVPARFGAPWTTATYGTNTVAGRYELYIPSTRTGTNGIEDGYDVVRHLANLPFTQEYISVKLCRLFVHEDFAHGYNFTSASLSPEGQLVKQCMLAWHTNSPQGQIRKVLSVIFNSDLFRNSGGQKVKTPMEYAVSTIRALRTSTNGTENAGTWTADSDGYAIAAGNTATATAYPLNRMGGMLLFDRDAPNGYSEAGSGWISAGTLAERVRFIQTTLMMTALSGTVEFTNKNDSISGGNHNITDPAALMKSRLTTVADQKNAGKVVDLFLGYIYPGEGRANLDLYRTAALNYLNSNDNGTPNSSLWGGLTDTSGVPTDNTTYENRLRGMISMLLTQQRFNEQ